MIISPNALATTNVLHAVNNAYKCTDEVYLFAQSEEDCHLYLQKLYWERDPEDDFIAPNFTLPLNNIMILRDDLINVDMESDLDITAQLVPYRTFMQNGYSIGDEWIRFAVLSSTDFPPVLHPQSSTGSLIVGDIFWWFFLTRSYFAPHLLRIFKDNSSSDASRMTPERMEDFKFTTAIAARLQFGEERKVHGILFYRPRFGQVSEYWRTDTTEHSVQLLRLPEYSAEYEKIFDSSDAEDYAEPEEDIYNALSFGDTQYRAGIPCVANLDTPVTAKELFFRWSGALTHFQLLDSPIIRPESWTLADHPEMTYHWQFLEERVLLLDPSLTDVDVGVMKYDYLGDISTGIRFAHPLGKDKVPDDSGDGNQNPYYTIDYYTARCPTFFGDNYEAQEASDIWELKGFGGSDSGSGNNSTWFNPNIEARTDPDTGTTYFTRDVGDNRFYAANKSLLKWYYAPETNTWKSNHTRPSTQDQLRILVTLPDVQPVRGCINPMSVPAIFNKPTFFMRNTSNSTFRFDPGVYEDYLVPHRVLIEGRVDNNVKTKWELMDEFTLEHFSARAHVYFSYPKDVKHIRITIQDWYGNTLLDDMRDDYFQFFSGETWQNPVAGRHYNTHSSIYANYVVRRGEDYTIGRCLDELPTTPIFISWNNTTPANFLPAREEWQKWKDRTIQSL